MASRLKGDNVLLGLRPGTMRIALLCNEYPPLPHGGIGSFTKTLAHELVRLGHQVTVFGSHPQAESFQDGPIQVELIRSRQVDRVGWIFERLAIRRYLKNAKAQNRFDIVELVDHNGLVPWSVKGLPMVIRLHLSWTVWWHHCGKPTRPRWMGYCEKQTLARHGHWIGCSKFILDETSRLTGLAASSTKVIYNPFPGELPKNVLPLADREKIILFAGRVSKRKGALAVAEAAKTFLPALPDYRLVFVGAQDLIEGELASEYCKRIVGTELAARIHFTDRVDHDTVMSWMRRSQVFVFPSQLEAFSIVVLEAMALGLPVIYSRSHSGPETISDGVNGYLVDPSSVEEIAQKVVMVCRDLPRAQCLADAARQVVADRFTPTICATETLAFYREILGRK